MILRPLAVGVVLTVLLFAIFLWLGPLFFIDGRRAFQINFTVGGLAGIVFGWALAGTGRRLPFVVLALIPLLLVMAAVGSHFQVFFPALDPALDKVFGSWMLWFTGFALIGAFARDARTTKRNELNHREDLS